MKIIKKLIAELGELSAVKKSDVESVKTFLSKSVDEFRPPYGRHIVKIKRTCAFIGTSNPGELFPDIENRRFYPLEIEKIDFSLFSKIDLIKNIYSYYRDQAKEILSSSNFQEKLNQINCMSKSLSEYLIEARNQNRVVNVYEDQIQNWVNLKLDKWEIENKEKIEKSKLYFSCAECKKDLFSFGIPGNFHKTYANVMRSNGFQEKSIKVNKKVVRAWIIPSLYYS